MIIAVIVLVVVVALLIGYYVTLHRAVGSVLGGCMMSDDIAGGARPISFPLREPWFELLRSGKKKAESRLNRGAYARVKVGDTVEIRRSRPKDDTSEFAGLRKFKATVKARTEYPSFAAMLEAETLKTVLPGVKSIEDGVKHYREFYSEEDEKAHGVVSFKFSPEE